ncbi:WxL protein peptidoglycan domain-containing protein [Dictyobacter kobayashii]|uniref:Cell surface protein n=1 Tax=Dictyobacter kobayashii TaxID=2014872 RepID=A0A402ANT1_9CHLR|nr:DUF916 domain-containing protein [Dictyobacter kobayashii]GCE20630.1 cell surface protein [Dictyobacter kobayashii]
MKMVSNLLASGTVIRSGARVLLLVFLLMGIVQCVSRPMVGAARADKEPFAFDVQPVFSDPLNPVTKAYFVMNAQVKGQVQNGLLITNTSDTSGEVIVYPLDAMTGESGGYAYGSHQAKLHDVGAWITLSRLQVKLGPGQSQVVPFQIKIPANARSGQHVGGLAVEDMTAVQTFRSKNSMFHVDLIQRKVLAVQITLPGKPNEQLAITGVKFDNSSRYQRLLIGLRNSGNMLVRALGKLSITDLQGKNARTQTIQIGTFVPQTTIDHSVYIIHKALPIGRYKALLTLSYGHQKQLNYTSDFIVTTTKKSLPNALNTYVALGDTQGFLSLLAPWQIIVGGCVILLVLGALIFWCYKLVLFLLRKTRKNKSREEKIPVSVEPTISNTREQNNKTEV